MSGTLHADDIYVVIHYHSNALSNCADRWQKHSFGIAMNSNVEICYKKFASSWGLQ